MPYHPTEFDEPRLRIQVMDPNLLPGARSSRWSWGLVAKGGVALCIAFGFGLMLGGFLPGPHSSGPFITERQLLSEGAHGIADILALRGHLHTRAKTKRVLFALAPLGTSIDSGQKCSLRTKFRFRHQCNEKLCERVLDDTESIREARALAEGLAS